MKSQCVYNSVRGFAFAGLLVFSAHLLARHPNLHTPEPCEALCTRLIEQACGPNIFGMGLCLRETAIVNGTATPRGTFISKTFCEDMAVAGAGLTFANWWGRGCDRQIPTDPSVCRATTAYATLVGNTCQQAVYQLIHEAGHLEEIYRAVLWANLGSYFGSANVTVGNTTFSPLVFGQQFASDITGYLSYTFARAGGCTTGPTQNCASPDACMPLCDAAFDPATSSASYRDATAAVHILVLAATTLALAM